MYYIVEEYQRRYTNHMAYSKDYRRMILGRLDEGYRIRELAEEYQISTNTIQRWKKFPNRKTHQFISTKINDDQLKADVKDYSDDYQHERAVRFNCSQRGIGKALKRLGITQKKGAKPPTSE